MKKVMELTIPIVVGLAWSVLAIATLSDVGDLAAAIIGPEPSQYGPAVEIRAEEHPLSAKLHVAGPRDGKAG
jgi:hypothetical protein